MNTFTASPSKSWVPSFTFSEKRPVAAWTGRQTDWLDACEQLQTGFHPIVDMHTGRTVGYEALLRGVDQFGFKSPLQFLDQVYDDGDILNVEKRLMERAFEAFVQIPGAHSRKLFLNTDGRVLAEYRGIADHILRLIDKHGLNASNVALEVSERYDFGTQNAAIARLLELRKKLGSLTLDDFGAGHANLQLFYHVEPNILKLDRFMISSIADDTKKKIFLHHIVNVAHLLGAQVVAEGVETATEYYVCKDLGCDMVQGYLVSKPTTDLSELRMSYGRINVLARKDRRAKANDHAILQAELDSVVPVKTSDSVDSVVKRLMDNPNASLLPVVDEVGAPAGIIHERSLKTFTHSRYGQELMRNKNVVQSIRRFLTPCPMANMNEPVEKILEIFSTAEGADGVLMVDNNLFAGFLHATSLLKVINEKNVRIARDQNPLTKLPGNTVINEYINDALVDDSACYHLAYFDFDNFKPFNDTFGFRQGDRAILMFADILRDAALQQGTFVGHVGGDDFFFAVRGVDADEAENTVKAIRNRFASDVSSLYPSEVRDAGRYSAKDRNGELCQFDLMTVSCALLHLNKGNKPATSDAIASIISGAKKHAKVSETGICAVEAIDS